MQIIGNFTTSVHKALKEIDPKYYDYGALVVCGSHTPDEWDIDKIIEKIKKAREQNTPTLLICWGHQLGAIEYAHNVLGIKDATSEEFGKGTFVVKKRKEMKVGLHEGETWWSNYEVIIDYKIPANFVSVPYHPEYQSSKDKPHPLLVKFLSLCKK